MTASTVSDNAAQQGNGGGILNLATKDDSQPTTSTLTFCTLAGNRADSGAGMASEEYDQTTGNVVPENNKLSVQVRTSIVAGNQSKPGIAIVGPLMSKGYNLFQNVDPGEKGSTDRLLDTSVDLSQYIDPTLRINSGPDGKPAPTQTLALLPASGNPAIDVIPLASCNILDSATKQPIMTDQRGMPRPDDHEPSCDMGAYESSG